MNSLLKVRGKVKALKISLGRGRKEISALSADRNKIRQVISNLIDNSIKYTPQGFVKVSLSKFLKTEILCSKLRLQTLAFPRNYTQSFQNLAGPRVFNAQRFGLGLCVSK